jgi:hypothetical protein
MNITIKTVPHSEQRYPTCGDWFWENGTLHIRVSELSDWRFEALIAVHELWESFLCKHRKITQDEVDKFDKQFEARRQDESEPGDAPDAPYRREHCSATGVERILASELQVTWDEYEKEVP